MNLPGHDCTVEEFNNECRMVQRMTLWQVDLMNPITRQRSIDKTLKKSKVKSLLMALMDKDIPLTEEQMNLMKEEG